MLRIISIGIYFILGIVLLSQAFSDVSYWKNMSEKEMLEFYNSKSDKDIAFEIDYVIYRNYVEQLKTLKINTRGIISKVDYKQLKDIIENAKENGINTNVINSKTIKESDKKDSTKSTTKRKFPFIKKKTSN